MNPLCKSRKSKKLQPLPEQQHQRLNEALKIVVSVHFVIGQFYIAKHLCPSR